MSNRSRERLAPPQAESEAPSRLQRVVHFELDRMHSLAIALPVNRRRTNVNVEPAGFLIDVAGSPLRASHDASLL